MLYIVYIEKIELEAIELCFDDVTHSSVTWLWRNSDYESSFLPCWNKCLCSYFDAY